MPSRHYQSTWRRRYRRRQAIKAALPFAIPVALAAAAGAVVAFSSGGGAAHISQSALANCGGPSASASAAPGTGTEPSPSASDSGGAASDCSSGSASASPSATPTATASAPAVDPEAGQPDLAETNPVDPMGKAISLTQSAGAAAASLNCTLTVPASPLSAAGLAVPWQLGDGCTESNASEQAFAEATILAPDGQVTIYDPLVITQGTQPAVTPKPPAVPSGSKVIIDVGFNGNNLVLTGAGAAQGQCVDAFGNSVISQTAACDAPAFYADANAQIAHGTLRVPRLRTGSDGLPCETTESFSLIDQDQSDNVDSAYLITRDGRTAQDSAANQQALGGAAEITNGSDDGLLAHFVDPALGCTPFKAPDVTSPDGSDSSQALESLSARQDQGEPRALLPVSDPQLQVAGQASIGKTNAYRTETDQPPLAPGTDKAQNAATYCQDMVNDAPGRLRRDLAAERGIASPVAATGTNLATFLGARLSASFTNLNCQDYGLTNPVKVTADGNGVATAVSYNPERQEASVPGGMVSQGPAGGYNRKMPWGRRHHRENGAGM